MKNIKKTLVVGLLMLMSLTTAGGITALADTVNVSGPMSTNIATTLSNDAFTFTDYDGKSVEYVVAGPNVGSDRTYTMANVHNGDVGSWDVVSPSVDGTTKSLAWLNIDLGDTYAIDKIAYTMNHDWKGVDVVIQAATSADYSDAITIYNNDIDNSLGCGVTFSADSNIPVQEYLNNYGDIGMNDQGNGNTFSFTPIAARHVRVTNNQYGDASIKNFTAIGEVGIFVYSKTTPENVAEIAPVTFSKPAGVYTEKISIELTSIYADAKIYYTLDGSVPTTESLKYENAIEIDMDSRKLIRASAYVNGVLSIPVTAKYATQDELVGKNVALNKPVTVKSFDMSEDWTNSLKSVNKDEEEGASAASRINDGSFDMWYALSTEKNNGRGWAIIDLEAEYYIDYVVYEAYWDWWMGNNIIEIAKSADFSDAVRIYDYTEGVQTGMASNCLGMVVDANVEGRYIRVTNAKQDNTALSAWTEIQAIAGKKPSEGTLVGQNIALNKSVSVKSLDMTADWTAFVEDTNQSQTAGNAEQYVTDGQFDFWHAINTRQKGKAWFVIDLGENYWLDRIMYDAYWDWSVSQHQIQIAKNADFSDAITVFEYESELKTSLGKEIKFPETEGRYIRVTNAIEENGNTLTVLTELQAFVCEPPVAAEEAYVESYKTLEAITVENGTAWDSIEFPAYLNVKYSDGSSKKVTGACEMPEGFEGKGGTYTAKFVVTDTSNLNDVYGLLETVEVEVIVEKMSPSISIEIAERIVYDGKEPSVTVNSNVNDYTVSYYQGNTKLDGYPKKAGTYKVVVTIAETSNNTAASSEKTFVIVDYSALIAKISEVSALDEKNYTNASWLSLVTQKETAQKIIDDNIAMQLEIDEALQNLSSSVANLVSKADFSMLQTAIASAEALILDEYEETGKDVFIAALAKAKGIFENGDALQKDVDAAESNLKLAQMALKKIEKETNSGGCGSTVMVGGIASILALVGVAAFVMRKKEDDK